MVRDYFGDDASKVPSSGPYPSMSSEGIKYVQKIDDPKFRKDPYSNTTDYREWISYLKEKDFNSLIIETRKLSHKEEFKEATDILLEIIKDPQKKYTGIPYSERISTIPEDTKLYAKKAYILIQRILEEASKKGTKEKIINKKGDLLLTVEGGYSDQLKGSFTDLIKMFSLYQIEQVDAQLNYEAIEEKKTALKKEADISLALSCALEALWGATLLYGKRNGWSLAEDITATVFFQTLAAAGIGYWVKSKLNYNKLEGKCSEYYNKITDIANKVRKGALESIIGDWD